MPESGINVIVGAGPAGLTAAYVLAKAGKKPVVCEQSSTVGGIARTEIFKGYRFDMGGHRFFTKSEEIEHLWNEILGADFLRRPRLSRIYYRKRFFDYPLKPFNALRNLGPLESLRVLASYVRWHLVPYRTETTFAQWVTNRFGKRLFDIFFRSYTEKVWGISTDELSSDWAAQRIKNLSLGNAVLNALVAQRQPAVSLIEEFHYPRLGPGMMWSAMTERVEHMGGNIRLDTSVGAIHHDGSAIRSVQMTSADGEQRVKVDTLISSMPLPALVRALRPLPPTEVVGAAGKLRHRDFLTVGLIVNRADVFPDNWIYVHDPAVRVGRIQNYKNWSPDMVPDQNTTSLGLEYFCTEDEPLWRLPDEALVRLGIDELAQIGLCARGDVVSGCVFRVPKAYPMYDHGYRDEVETIKEYLSRFGNLHTVGRNGLHRYDNQDHAMLTGLFAGRNVCDGAEHDVWNANVDGGYLEEHASVVSEMMHGRSERVAYR